MVIFLDNLIKRILRKVILKGVNSLRQILSEIFLDVEDHNFHKVKIKT